MIFDLPTSIELSGKEYNIRTDYRDILRILIAFDDPELKDNEKLYVCLYVLYEDFEDMSDSLYKEAYDKALKFIDHGAKKDGFSARTMDWEQDEPILFPAINRVAGMEVRSVEYMHWWTFMGLFMEIKSSIYAQVLNLRQKKARGKKLEKWEKDFWSDNKNICVLKPKLTEEEQAEKDKLLAILG